MGFTKTPKFALTVLAGLFALSLNLSVYAEPDEEMLIRKIPLEVSGYSEAAKMDECVQGADTTFELITTTQPLLVHMEAIRRAYHVYGQNTEEKNKLLAALKDRYMKDPDNADKFFDYGYAQLVMDGNKNGLFFLRKANDKIASAYTSMAYGIAQIDIDRTEEGAPVDSLTTRKMDAVYKLKDALMYNREDVLPGIWPTYIRILDGIKTYSAYDSLRNEDVTTIYVPYGSTSTDETAHQFLALTNPDDAGKEPVASKQKCSSGASAETVLSATVEGETINPDKATESVTTEDCGPRVDSTCEFSEEPPNWSALAQTKSMDLNKDQKAESINFFNTESGQPYMVRVLSSDNRVIGEFKSYKAPYIYEDLDGDGQFELVVRQYDKDPYNPLQVYRWNGQCFGKDNQVEAYFK